MNKNLQKYIRISIHFKTYLYLNFFTYFWNIAHELRDTLYNQIIISSHNLDTVVSNPSAAMPLNIEVSNDPAPSENLQSSFENFEPFSRNLHHNAYTTILIISLKTA